MSPNSGICACGCGQPTNRWKETCRPRGQIKGEFAKFAPNHHLIRAHSPYKGYQIDPATGCWIYLGALDTNGYPGHVLRDGKSIKLSHWHYEQAKGPIPDGLILDHLCRNPPCVNPDHLEAVTYAENTRRSPIMTKLTKEQAAVIKGRLMMGEIPARIQRDYPQVTRQAITHILTGRSWRDVIPIGT